MRRIILFGFLFLFALSFSCKKEEEPGAEERIEIAVIPKGTTHEFWKAIHAGAVKGSRELDVDIIWKGPQKEDDREQQVQVVENFIARQVDAIVLAPLDERALAIPVSEAARRNIPVVIIDSGLQGKDFISFVATDNYKGGTLGGRRLGELLGGSGKVVMLRYMEGSESTTQREQGFLDTMEKEFPDIELLSTNQYAGPTTESAYQKSENLLNRFPESEGSGGIDGIFCPNESSAFGMLRALQDADRAGKVTFVGFDSSEKLVQALRSGEIKGLVLQNPFRMGYLGVKTAVEHLRGKKVEARIDTGVTLVTKENMDRPEIKELLAPDLSEWLE